ncbi:hypothetical protein PG988_001156 [Apiospora saccharicola]
MYTIRAVLSTDLVDIEDRDGRGKTPLCWAVELAHVSAVRASLEKGEGEGAFMALAREFRHRDVINELSVALDRRCAGN